jgi:hypothetical protein
VDCPATSAVSPKLVPSDFQLFGLINNVCPVKNFTGDIADTVAVKMWLLEDHSNFYENGMQALVQW